MEFGKVNNLAGINWQLPAVDPLTTSYLAGRVGQAHFYIGAPAWGRREWLGTLYPPGAAAKDFLFHYARNFNCIELNSSHYQIPSTERIRDWSNKVTANFRFCPKVAQDISHRGLNNLSLIKEWWRALDDFGEFLGPSLLQLPPSFDYQRKAELFQFLRQWPDAFQLAIELRHGSWFSEGRVLPALVEYLQSRRVGLVILDVAGHRELVHSSVSAPFTVVRFIGNNLDASDFHRGAEWSARLREWRSLEKIYFMVHEPDDIRAPEMADWLIAQFNATCGAALTPMAKALI